MLKLGDSFDICLHMKVIEQLDLGVPAFNFSTVLGRLSPNSAKPAAPFHHRFFPLQVNKDKLHQNHQRLGESIAVVGVVNPITFKTCVQTPGKARVEFL